MKQLITAIDDGDMSKRHLYNYSCWQKTTIWREDVCISHYLCFFIAPQTSSTRHSPSIDASTAGSTSPFCKPQPHQKRHTKHQQQISTATHSADQNACMQHATCKFSVNSASLTYNRGQHCGQHHCQTIEPLPRPLCCPVCCSPRQHKPIRIHLLICCC